jgi:hypothetical protein
VVEIAMPADPGLVRTFDRVTTHPPGAWQGFPVTADKRALRMSPRSRDMAMDCAAGIAVGLGMGLAIGLAIDSIGAGIGIGLAFGIAIAVLTGPR